MGKIVVSSIVESKLKELIIILYEKQYFGFKDTAIEYVQNIYEFIYSIDSKQHYKCKKTKHGEFYARYKANAKTQYCATFDKSKERYYINNIISNHTREYSVYIKGL